MTPSFQSDARALQKTFQNFESSLQKAAVGYLNGIAFEAQKFLKAHVKEAFDGSVPFTERGFVVTKATPTSSLKDMFAEVKILPAQSAYLRFQIDGGVRKTGDAGSGPFDLMVFGARKNKAGNIRWGYPKQLSKQNREEKLKRTSLRAQREAARAQGQDTSELAWFRVSRNKPGIFFGEVGGVKGYWQRPKRSKAARKRIPGVISVRPTEQLKPLLSVADHARYKPRYQYQAQITKAMRVKATPQVFASELNRQMSKRK